MKIAVWHNLPSGGGKRALYSHIKGLISRGHQVEAWCPASASQEYLSLKPLCSEHVLPFEVDYGFLGRVPYGRSILAPREMRVRIETMDSHCRACAEQISAGKFDILFANSCRFFHVPGIGRFTRLPSVIYLGEPYRWLYEANPRLPWEALPAVSGLGRFRITRLRQVVRDYYLIKSLRIQVREERNNAAAFGRILVNSLFSRENLLRAYGLESSVCYLGVDFGLFSPTNEPLEDYVIGLGTLYKGKGVDRAIRAVGNVPAEKRPRFLWIGNSSGERYEAEMKRLAESCGVRFEVRVMVSDKDLRSALSRARAMIYTPRLEPFGLAPLEANACGVPVVGIAEGGIRESVHNGINGFLADGDDAKVLADLLVQVLSETRESKQLRLSALSHVRQNWSMPRAIDCLEEELEKTISVHRKPH